MNFDPVRYHLPPQNTIETLQRCSAQFYEALEDAIPDGETDGHHTEEFQVSWAQDLSIALRRAMIEAQLPIMQASGVSEAELLAKGSKYANNARMGILQNVLKTPGFSMPQQTAIDSDQMEAFLTECAPEAMRLWKELGEDYAHYLNDKPPSSEFLRNPELKQKIRIIQASIMAAFEEAIENPEVLAKLAPPAALSAMLEDLHRSHDYVMVRSTGAEDSKAAANAGGNVSVPYVLPTQDEVLRAMGRVVASYFKRGSLKNRIDAGLNPFSERLQLAVLTQQLIGEPVLTPGATNPPETIPTSFVCFSSEPLYVGTERFRTMRISATFGHGEGVVGTQGIPNDSWIILHSELNPHRLYIIPDIKKKKERLAPMQSSPGAKPKLAKVTNPEEFIKRPALTQRQLRSIFSNAVIMEAFFGDEATDIEGICKGGMTYFVQARPRNTPPHQANYFDTSGSEEAILDSVQAIPIVPGRSNVVEIASRDQILVADTLEQALKLYKKAHHRLVVVSRPSPLLSHAVVNFSHLGVPCLLARDRPAIIKLVKNIQPDQPLEVCTQTAKLYLWDRQAAAPETCLKEGFGKHPAKISPSLLSTSLRLEKGRETPDEIRILLLRLRTATTRQAGLQILQELRSHPLVADVQSIGQRQRQLLGKNPNASVQARAIVRSLTEYDAAVRSAFNEAIAVFSKGPERALNEDRLQRLFHAEVLEATLLEPYDEPGAIGRCSLMQVERMSQATTELIAYQKKLGSSPAQFADLLMDASRIPNSSPEFFASWKKFLLQLEASVKKGEMTRAEANNFKAIIRVMRKSGVLPMWFTFYFQPGVTTFHHVLDQFAGDAPFLAELTARRGHIKQLTEQMDRFAHPETFELAWTELESEVMAWASPELLSKIKSASPLVQNVAYQNMERLVTTLDTAVKTMKVGADFKDEKEQTRLFKRMLMPYHHLMSEWALKMIPQGAIPTYTGWNIPNYVTAVKKILVEIPDEDVAQLLPSADFSVNSALLGSKTQFQYVLPVTLEDVLTLQHQNLLVFLSVLNLRSLPNALTMSKLPEELIKVVASIEEAGKPSIRRLGLSVTENEVLYRANYTMREHSAQIQLIYEKESQNVSMRVQFTGRSIWDRWSKVADWVKLLDEADVLRLAGSVDVVGVNEVSFAWDINSANIPQAMAQFFEMAEFSMGKMESIRLPIESPLIDGLLNRESVETPENALMVRKFLHFASTRPTRHLLDEFIEKASHDTAPRWIMKHILPADLQNTAKKLFEGRKADQGWKVLEVAYETRRIGTGDFVARLREHIHEMPSAVQSEVMRYSFLRTLPSQSDLASEDLWTRLTALYHLKECLEENDPAALNLVQPALQRLLAPPESFSSLTPVFRQAWEGILCHLVDSKIVEQETGQVLSVLVKARCKLEESTIVLLERLWKQYPSQRIGEIIVALFAKLGFSLRVVPILVEILKNGFGVVQFADAMIAAEKEGDNRYQRSLHLLLSELLNTLIEQDAHIAFAGGAAELLNDPLHTQGAVMLLETYLNCSGNQDIVRQAANVALENPAPLVRAGAATLLKALNL